MGNENRQQRIAMQSFLFLLGLLLVLSCFLMPSYSYIGSPQKLPYTHSFILSEESPSYEYNISSPDFGISSLHTNNTSVNIVVWHQDQVVFNVTNVQEIIDFDIEFPVSGSYMWRLEIVRQDGDVSIDLTTYQWAIAIAYVKNPPLQLLAMTTGTGITLYALYLLFKSYRGLTSYEARGAKFLAIVVLLLIGTVFCHPLIKGILGGDFIPVYTVETLPDETYQFVLNETHPTSLLNLSSLYPQGQSSVSIKIHSMTSSQYPFQLSVITSNTFSLTLEEESDNNDWWITIPLDVNSPSVVSFERIDTDLNGAFNVEIQYQIRTPREDIIMPAIFGAFGLIAIIGGLSLANRLDR